MFVGLFLLSGLKQACDGPSYAPAHPFLRLGVHKTSPDHPNETSTREALDKYPFLTKLLCKFRDDNAPALLYRTFNFTTIDIYTGVSGFGTDLHHHLALEDSPICVTSLGKYRDGLIQVDDDVSMHAGSTLELIRISAGERLEPFQRQLYLTSGTTKLRLLPFQGLRITIVFSQIRAAGHLSSGTRAKLAEAGFPGPDTNTSLPSCPDRAI